MELDEILAQSMKEAAKQQYNYANLICHEANKLIKEGKIAHCYRCHKLYAVNESEKLKLSFGNYDMYFCEGCEDNIIELITGYNN